MGEVAAPGQFTSADYPPWVTPTDGTRWPCPSCTILDMYPPKIEYAVPNENVGFFAIRHFLDRPPLREKPQLAPVNRTGPYAGVMTER